MNEIQYNTVLDLFCGCGGMSLGFEKAGYHVLLGIDIWKDALETYKYNHKQSKTLCADMASLNPSEVEKLLDGHKVDVIIGGPPCQSWSEAGSLKGIEDARGQLFFEYIRILRDKKPYFFVAENVSGMLANRHSAAVAGFLKLFDEAGYDVVVYFYNPNIYPETEYQKRLEAEKTLCENYGVELVEGEYDTESFYACAKGLENEPEKGKRCVECFKLRLNKTAEFCISQGISTFTTSIVISPHKNYELLSSLGRKIAQKHGLEYLDVNFRKKDGFLKTNQISRGLGLYRQNYCGCEFSVR